MYEIIFRARFERVFKKLDKKTKKKIILEIEKLAVDPFSHQDVKMIIGVRQKAFRLRISRWRVIYFVITRQKTIEVVDLFLRQGSDDYKNY